jgi:hypothetical protein
VFGILKLEKASTPNASVIECCFEIELGEHKYDDYSVLFSLKGSFKLSIYIRLLGCY